MGLLVDQMLWCTFVHIGMRLKLEEKVQNVDKEQNLRTVSDVLIMQRLAKNSRHLFLSTL